MMTYKTDNQRKAIFAKMRTGFCLGKTDGLSHKMAKIGMADMFGHMKDAGGALKHEIKHGMFDHMKPKDTFGHIKDTGGALKHEIKHGMFDHMKPKDAFDHIRKCKK
jgi:hypothetical protein